MRTLTPSSNKSKGLFSINEVHENAPQEIIFCVPLRTNNANSIQKRSDFGDFFSSGITTKAIIDGRKEILELDFKNRPFRAFEFEIRLKNTSIPFQVASSNFEIVKENKVNFSQFKIDHFYAGEEMREQFYDHNFLVLTPNWKKLDWLFLEHKILFTDFD